MSNLKVLNSGSDFSVPIGQQEIHFNEITDLTSLNGKYIKAVVVTKSNLVHSSIHIRRKVVLQDRNNNKISSYFFGEYADRFEVVPEQSEIVISNATVQRSTNDTLHQFRMSVAPTDPMPEIQVKPPSREYVANDHNSFKTPPSISRKTPPKPANGETAQKKSSTRNTSNTPSTSSRVPTTSSTPSTSGRVPTTSNSPSTSGRVPTTSNSPSTSGRVPTTSNTPSTSNTVLYTSNAPSTPGTSPPTAKAKTPEKYKYTRLADLRNSMIVNVYGIVKFFKPPYRTRGPDFGMTLRIVDQSLDEDEKGLLCNLFMKNKESLPHVVAIGDIVRLHRLRIQIYRDVMQGTKSPGFSSLVFEGDGYAHRSSTPLYTFTNDDRKMVDQLRSWTRLQDNEVSERNEKTLSSVQCGNFFDLSAQIVATAAIPTESCVALKVWDGTVYKGPLRWVDLHDHSFIWDKDLAAKARGYLVDVWVYDDHVESVSNLKPGEFMKIFNLHAANFQLGSVEFVVHKGTSYGRGVITLDEDHPAVTRLKGLFETAEQRRQAWNDVNGDALTMMQKRQQGFVTTDLPDPGTEAADVHGPNNVGDSRVQESGCEASNAQNAGHNAVNAQESGIDRVGHVQNPDSLQDDVCMQESATSHYNMKVSSIGNVLKNPAASLSKIRAKVIDFEPRVSDFVELWCPECNQRAKLVKVTPENLVTAKQKASEKSSPRRSVRLQKSTSTDSTEHEGGYSILTRRKRKLLDQQNAGRLSKEPPTRCLRDQGSSRSPATKSSKGVQKRSQMSATITEAKHFSKSMAEEQSNLVAASTKRKHVTLTSDLGGRDIEMAIAQSSDGMPELAVVSIHMSGPSVGDVLKLAQCGFQIRDYRAPRPSAEKEANTSNSRLHSKESSSTMLMLKTKASNSTSRLERDTKSSTSRLERDTMRSSTSRLERDTRSSTSRLERDTRSSTSRLEIGPCSSKSMVDHETQDIYIECPRCRSDVNETANLMLHQLNFKLTLSDGSDKIEVIVQKEEAINFLNLGTTRDLEKRMKYICPEKLSNASDASLTNAIQGDERPWLDCCIRGYYVRKQDKIIMRYSLCDTVLVDES